MAGIRTCDCQSQVERPNHYTTEPPDGLVMAKSGRLELWDNIYGHYRSTFKFNQCEVIGHQSKQSNSVEKTQNKGYYAVQDNSRSFKVILRKLG